MKRLGFLLLAACLVATPLVAGEQEDRAALDFYQRTGTHPPNVGFAMGPAINCGDDLGIGIRAGIDFKAEGLTLLIGADAVKIDGQSGTVTSGPEAALLWPHPQPVTLPYQTGNRTVGVYSFALLIRFGGP